ncbi:MAG TPA: glycosyltransferase [candidate division Zixibacteria bacterium]|nr:glycosyltransferase [candidate division Zixibacteria bacterium]
MADCIAKWVSMAFLAGPLVLFSERRFRNLPELPQLASPLTLPALSIIVPARNESVNLQRLLPTLTAISYPGKSELIVVDDSSTDETASIASRHGAHVIQLNDLPEGWSGKTHACHQGAMAATGEWLLFTDADTIHYPCGPAQAVAYANANGLDGLSIWLRQMTSKGLDGLALPVAFAGLFVGLAANNALINGQYILLRHDVYKKSGGFSPVAAESMEDLALGHRLQAKGYQVPLLRSDTVASVQMYTDTSSLWQGLVRMGAGSLRWMGPRSIITALFITSVMTPILAIVKAFQLHRNRKWALASWAVIAVSFVPWARRFGSAWLALLAPIGALMVQGAAVWGLLRRLFGRGTRWKGRQV